MNHLNEVSVCDHLDRLSIQSDIETTINQESCRNINGNSFLA
jgi:hypothetical protein